ncbi:MAG: hypothetical protein ACOYM3_10390 [Terrimicrobiaceae bacterium]
MTDAARGALRQGLAAAGTALVVAALHVPQPFLAILAAQLIGGIRCDTRQEFLRRLSSAWLGSLTGLLLLVAFPDQQWLSLPLFGAAAGLGIVAAFRRWGSAPAILFAMGIGGMFSSGIVIPEEGLVSGLAHASSLSIAVIVCTLSWNLLMQNPAPAESSPSSSPRASIIGISTACSLVLACLTVPAQTVVMTIATMTTILALETSAASPQLMERSMGAVLGVLASVAFIILVSGTGNNLAVFLLALALAMGAFEGMAVTTHAKAALFRQAAALFAVAVTMLPRPEPTLQASGDRMLAVLLGFAVAAACYRIAGAPSEADQSRFNLMRRPGTQ